MKRVLAGCAVVVIVALAGFGLRGVAAQDGADKPAFYTEKVLPILQTNCAKCHIAASRGGLSLATKAGTMKGGRDGVVIVPGDPANSLLVKLIRHEGAAGGPPPMPQGGDKLSDADIATIEQWVKAGAVMPDDPQP